MKKIILIILISYFAAAGFGQNFSYVEYFINEDPGYGMGINVPVPGGADLSIEFESALHNLDDGLHTIFVRARQDDGYWSHTINRSFLKQRLPVDMDPEIVYLEYFFDSDPGFGQANPVELDNLSPLSVTTNLPLESLNPGLHSLYVRSKDENGRWSIVMQRSFVVSGHPDDPPIMLISAEYFIDNDPGPGNGEPVQFDPNNGSVIQQFEAALDGYEPGEHRLYIRSKDENGSWSIVYTETFEVEESPIIADFSVNVVSGSVPLTVQFTDETYISEPDEWLWDFGDGNTSTLQNPQHTYSDPGSYTVSLTATGPEGSDTEVKEDFITVFPPLYSLEYFFDEDPGYGNGIAVYYNARNTGLFAFNIPLEEMEDGLHTLFARIKDTSNVWTHTFNRSFLLTRIPGDADPLINRMEYFMDEDPGYGQATPIAFNPDALPEVTVDLPLASLSPGLHTLYVRSRDENGRWGIVMQRSFLKGTHPDDPLKELISAEYFIDSDPGPGNGTKVLFDPNSGIQEQQFEVNLEGYEAGEHKIYVRAKDDGGSWSITHTETFEVEGPDIFAAFSAEPTAGVAPLTVQFTDESGGNPVTWEWDFEHDGTIDATIQHPEFTYDEPGIYTVSLIVSDGEYSDTEIKEEYITVTEPVVCLPPVDLAATDITSHTTLLSWNPGGDESEWDILWGEAGFDPMTEGTLVEGITEISWYLTGLTPETAYDFYVRALCNGGNYSIWAGPESFITEEETVVTIPTVATAIVEQITQNGAISGGNVTNDGGAEVTARGVVWSTYDNPTVEQNEGITYNGEGTGSWVSELAELTPATAYFVRAYATNNVGTAYGEQLTFTTLSGGPPAWEPNPNMQYNMQVIGKLQYEDETFSLNGDDLVGAFVGEECRGLMSPDPDIMGIIFLTIGSNSQSGETITFKAYLQNTDEIVELNQTLTFENQLQVGSIPEPYIFNYHNIGPPNWEPNPFLQYNMQIIGQLEYEDGNISMNGNDIVGAFVGEECRGVMSPDPNFMGIIFLTVGSNLQSGETVTFKAYLADEDRIVEINQTLIFENQQQVGSIPNPYIFSYGELISQAISLPAGWSGISSYVIPSSPAMEDVFAPIADELIIVQTMTEIYFPGENINTIGNWESHSAYKVKTNVACFLNIQGEYETNMTVSLNAGWNLLPVVTPDGANPADLFMPVNDFVIAKEVAGTGVYWPQYNINSIGNIVPGKAYFVLMTAPGLVDFTGMKSATSGTLTGFRTLSGLEGPGITPTPSTHTIAILPEALKALEEGAIIGAYDQAGNCFGVTVYNSEFISLTAFGDDPTTAQKDGFFEGETIFFKTLTGFHPARAGLSGLSPTFDQSLPQSKGLFTENGLSAITGFEAATGIGYDVFGSSISIYPNPTNGVVNITGLGSETKITVTDVRGQVVFSTEPLNSGLFSFDLSCSNPGVYFVNIQHNKQSIFRKIVLR